MTFNDYQQLVAERFIDLSQDLICVVSLEDGHFKYVNTAWQKMLGYTRDELLAQPFLNFIHPDDHSLTSEEFERLTGGRLTEDFENRYIHKDGSTRYISWKATPEPQKKIACFLGRDITQKKNIRQQLCQTVLDVERKVKDRTTDLETANKSLKALWNLSSLLDTDLVTISGSILSGIVGLSGSQYGFFGFVNRAEDTMTIYNWSEEAIKECEINDKPLRYSIEKSGIWGNAVRDRKPFVLNDYQESCENKKGLPDGHVALKRVLVVPVVIAHRVVAIGAVANKKSDYNDDDIQQLQSFLISAHLIVEHKRTEGALAASEARYRAISEDSPLLICRLNPDYIISYVNDAYCKYFKKSPEALIGCSFLDVVCEADRLEVTNSFCSLTHDSPVQSLEHQVVNSTGRLRWQRWTNRALYDERGRLIAYQAIGEDITERREAEDGLKEALIFNQLILNTTPVGILIFKESGPCTMTNSAAVALIGASEEQLLTLNYRHMESYRKNGILADMEESLRTGKVLQREVHTINTFGKEVWFEGVVSTFRFEKEKHILYFFKDIKDRKKTEAEKAHLESQLRQAVKMQAVGTLAGGIAHEFNNMLGVIMGGVELARDEVPAHGFARDQLDSVLKASNRVKNLVKQILSFSRQSHQQRKSIDLCLILKESLKLIRSSMPSSVMVIEDIDQACPNILADPAEIQQIVLNLHSNAVWAMKETGTIEVTLRQVELNAVEGGALGIAAGSYVKMSIRDNGIGMDEKTRSRIFDPFFTRKEVGDGTGMGLSIVYSIMESYGGAITVDSELGRGTTFHLFFDITDKPELKREAANEELPPGNERILFVDDEKAYAEMGAEMLGRLGYQIDLKTDSREALEAFRSAPDNYDLVITDQVMPHLSGDELALKVRLIRPDIPIILCTGYSTQIDETKARALGINEFVHKPLLKKEVAQLIRKVLDRRC